ncbi:hypothetical protein B0T13DRAFT_56109 [Neurospora crassa]|nr:hypothetical protein B0T13DRAFT_56109 [Neurospora crassa]
MQYFPAKHLRIASRSSSRQDFYPLQRHQMVKQFKGEVVYSQEVDKHLPHLTVGQTLEFTATVRTLPPASRTCPGPSTVIKWGCRPSLVSVTLTTQGR